MELKDVLTRIIDGKDLSRTEAEELMSILMSGKATDAQIGALLTALRIKGETVDEITGFVKVMRDNATPITTKHETIIDTCGTGGDGAQTFNISTAAAFVVAGAGICVAKHGNRSVSSKCGSADVLKALGIQIDLSPEKVGKCLDDVGIGFLFAPLLHSAMKHVIGARKEMGVRTVFNILGPMTNPAGAQRQIMGVFDPTLIEPIAHVLKNVGSEHVMVFHGSGLDEITTAGETSIAEIKNANVATSTIKPEDFGIQRTSLDELKGGDADRNAQIIMDIFKGSKGPRRDITVLNAGAGIYVGGKAATIGDGVKQAEKIIDSGKAGNVLGSLKELSNS